jgi:hypothetical protein
MAPTHTANLTRETTTDQKTLPRTHQFRAAGTAPDRRRLSAKARHEYLSGSSRERQLATTRVDKKGPADEPLDNRRKRHSYMARPTRRTKQAILIPVAGNELRPSLLRNAHIILPDVHASDHRT